MRMLYRLRRDNQRWRAYPELLVGENRWRAMRYSFDAGLLDLGRQRIVPFAELLEELIELVREDAQALGCVAEIEGLREILARGTSAHRQLADVRDCALQTGANDDEALARGRLAGRGDGALLTERCASTAAPDRVAPMMDYTDRHCRYLLRLLSPHCAALHRDGHGAGARARRRSNACSGSMRPSIRSRCSSVARTRSCSRARRSWAPQRGYDEINLNVGCPSDRVQSGRFGACLMAEPELVADCLRAMLEAVADPGDGQVPDRHRRSRRLRILRAVRAHRAGAGVDVFIVHARKAHPARPEPEGEPRGAAAALRRAGATQGGASGADGRS